VFTLACLNNNWSSFHWCLRIPSLALRCLYSFSTWCYIYNYNRSFYKVGWRQISWVWVYLYDKDSTYPQVNWFTSILYVCIFDNFLSLSICNKRLETYFFCNKNEIKCQFHQRSMSSFYSRRSRKCKKDSQV